MSWKTKTFLSLSVVFCFSLLTITDAEARRGGSIGGRSGFSSGGGRSSYSSGGGFRGSSSSSRSYGGGYSSAPSFFFFGGGGYGGGGETCGDATSIIVAFIIIAVIIGYIIIKTRRTRRELLGQGSRGMLGPGEMEGTVSVARLSIAFFATEKKIQAGLNALAESGQAGTQQGDSYILREACIILARSKDAISKFYFEQHSGLSKTSARSKLEEIGQDLRSRYEEEGIRADEAGVRKAKGIGKEEEMEVAEYIVVSIAVAFNPPILQKTQITDVVKLVELIREMGNIGDRLLGLEVVWDPVDEGEVLSSEDLDLQYPELQPI